MFIKTKNIIMSTNLLAASKNFPHFAGNANKYRVLLESMHTSASCNNLVKTATLPIPKNIDIAETTRFSPHRSRDISANVIVTQKIDITADNSQVAENGNSAKEGFKNDPHVQSYDCNGVVSLNSVMQSNVPCPFGGMHKFSHLNMPGGQWSQEGKFTSQNLHSSHYTALREQARSGWLSYDQNATLSNVKEHANGHSSQLWVQCKREYTTKTEMDNKPIVLTKKEQLKKAFKEYGATIVVFHVAISLVSLGGFYCLISSGINMTPALESLGLLSSSLSNKMAAGASTFVVAYAIHKVFAPVRISITLTSTPFIVRFLRSKGYLKKSV